MNNKVAYEDSVKITCSDNGRVVDAEIDNFRFQESLVAFVATNKIIMKWNGRSVYVGNAAGLEFTTPGPSETASLSDTRQHRRR